MTFKNYWPGLIIFLFLFVIASCGQEDSGGSTAEVSERRSAVATDVPVFNADSAFHFIKQQLAFGPRAPFTEGHEHCRNWLVSFLEAQNWQVEEQVFQASLARGARGRGYNIIARWNPAVNNRILLAAHYDTRDIADYDPDPEMRDKPIPGADDGASGVAVLLELARKININQLPGLGIDIVLFDLEDQGNEGNIETWCLGAQYYARNPDARYAKPRFGILLDMVGAQGARFSKEGFSMQYAANYVDQVWNTAHRLGFSGHFDMSRTREVIDDHYFVNTIARIPMLNIINRPMNTETGFGHYWHTHADDIDIISKSTLKAVGQTVLQVIYNEASPLM